MSVKNGAVIYFTQLDTNQLGSIWIAASEVGLVEIGFDDSADDFVHRVKKRLRLENDPISLSQDALQLSHPAILLLQEGRQQLLSYLNGDLAQLNLPLDWTGISAFQTEVLRATLAVPPGETKTYQQLANQIGHPSAARAVGRAEATNPIPLVIPCHRIVGSDGSLRGYGGRGGITTKDWLQKLEKGMYE